MVPWVHVEPVGETWPTEMTDAVVEVLECEKDNREQRRKKRKIKTILQNIIKILLLVPELNVVSDNIFVKTKKKP